MIVNLNSEKTHIVVVGGGTAGWITALWMRMNYPDIKITVVKSSDIGILGAGEGTTPQFLTLLDDLNIQLTEIIKYANGTLKNGIKFTNWHGKNDSFFHSFGENEDLSINTFSINGNNHLSLIALEQIANGKNLDNIQLSSLVSIKNSTKYVIQPNFKNASELPITHLTRLGSIALHFNATMLADLLEKKGKQRNINIIDGMVTKINCDSNDFITSLTLNEDKNLKCDFVFDCTGFKRLIIGKHYKSKFVSYKKFLPVKKAIPFQIKIKEEDEIPPYTEATALKYGWMWKIPAGDRFGCGYVYDSDLVSDLEIKKEIDEVTGTDNEITRSFSFEPGFFEKIWIKNCFAVGLSSGFVEPLEATSIFHSIVLLKHLFLSSNGIVYRDEKQIDFFNKYALGSSYEIMNFIHTHYITQRNDTEFWKNFSKNNERPEPIKNFILNGRRIADVKDILIKYNLFESQSWLHVGAGINLYDRENVRQMFLAINSGSRVNQYILRKNRFLKTINLLSTSVIDHRSFIEFVSDYWGG